MSTCNTQPLDPFKTEVIIGTGKKTGKMVASAKTDRKHLDASRILLKNLGQKELQRRFKGVSFNQFVHTNYPLPLRRGSNTKLFYQSKYPLANFLPLCEFLFHLVWYPPCGPQPPPPTPPVKTTSETEILVGCKQTSWCGILQGAPLNWTQARDFYLRTWGVRHPTHPTHPPAHHLPPGQQTQKTLKHLNGKNLRAHMDPYG